MANNRHRRATHRITPQQLRIAEQAKQLVTALDETVPRNPDSYLIERVRRDVRLLAGTADAVPTHDAV